MSMCSGKEQAEARSVEYASNATHEAIAARILAGQRIAITSHMKVDGDAIGSMLALGRALRQLGRAVDLLVMGPLEPNLASLAHDMPLLRIEQPPTEEYDLIVVVDTGAWSQLEPIVPWLRERRDRVVGIDHHARGDDIASLRIVEPRCASTTQLLLPVLDAMKCEITGGTGGVAEALFLGLATDTGWFRYDNADADVFAAAARLLKHGVNKSRLYQIVEETHRRERLALESRALASLEYLRDGEVAIMSLCRRDFEETGGGPEDMTGVVNLPLSVASVRVSVLLSQTEPGQTKLSFRSKPPLTEQPQAFFDVNDIAHEFGGGGHVNAAGARVKMDLQATQQAVRDLFQRWGRAERSAGDDG